MSAARLIVEVPWGPHAGLKVAVAPGERLRVGRNERADLAIPSDAQLSAIHFELSWDGAAAHLRELDAARDPEGPSSPPRVKVDGKLASTATLGDGAWVRAGGTDFVLHVEGGARRRAEREDEDLDPEIRRFARQERDRARAHRAGIAFALRAAAGPEQHLHAVLDAARDARILELLHASVDPARSLFEGDQGARMEELAPHLVRFVPGSPLLDDLVLEGWGKRWGIFFTSTQPLKEVRRHLRRFLMVEDDEDGSSLYFRFYDPEVLRVFLPTCLPRQADEWWSDVDAFYFEDEAGNLVHMDRAAAEAAAAAAEGERG